MKKTLTTAAALAACVGTQLFAQSAKEDVITFSLTKYAQSSVSTSKTSNNAGNWSDPPIIYKTATSKLATADVLKAIAIVLHGNAGFYDSRAQLVLVQGELGGFFGYPYIDSFNFGSGSTTAGDNIRFAMGRNMTNNPITGALPPGHNQPWGQIFVKESNSKGEVTLCENVSFFFAIEVQECYDCFYLNSFITDTTFKFTERTGPPCCAGSAATSGNGKDKYYMTLRFDNTDNNPYLNPGFFVYPAGTESGWFVYNRDEFYEQVGGEFGLYPGVVGLRERDDGVNPDGLPYQNSISSTVRNPLDQHSYDIYTMRFALNGIMTYNWSLKFVNKTDAFPDYVGGGSFPVTGYGYVSKVCSLFSGNVNFNEKIVSTVKCCLDIPWYSPGDGQFGGFWYGVGDWDVGAALFGPTGAAPAGLLAGDSGYIENYFDTATFEHLGDCVPVNTDLDLSFHVNFNYGYAPLQNALDDFYPQPGFEGIWDTSEPIVVDVQPPQGDDRPADGQPR